MKSANNVAATGNRPVSYRRRRPGLDRPTPHSQAPQASAFAGVVCLVITTLTQTGCQEPQRVAQYPEDTLQVRYESSSKYSGCLIACVAMAANYLLDKTAFSEASIHGDLLVSGLDESRIGDVRKYLAQKGLHLITLSGRLDGKPPASLKYWLNDRGYPVICVINRQPSDPAHNHAVVVIGISKMASVESADRIHYLDPSSPLQLHSEEFATFETNWARGQHAMMIVVQPPPG